MTRRLEKCYLDRNKEDLLAQGVPVEVLTRWSAHWSGRLVEARDTVMPLNLPRRLAHLVAADEMLLRVKLGQQFDSPVDLHRATAGSQFIMCYARYYQHFWKSQKCAWRQLFGMLWFSVLLRDSRAWVMSLFLLGHMLVIRGQTRIGFQIAANMATRTRRLVTNKGQAGRFFYDVLAVFPFTLFVAKEDTSRHEATLVFIEDNLPPDPYYRALFFLAQLYCAAYGGDTLGTEIYAQKLLQEHESGHLKRYKIVVEVMTLLPLALRGYGHLVESKMKELLSRVESCGDPAVHSAYFRACAIVSLYQGDLADAYASITKSRAIGSSTGLAAAWREIDTNIEAYASGAKTFDPMSNICIGGSHKAPFLPKFGSLMMRLVQVTGAAAAKGDEWFVESVSEALKIHLSCSGLSVVAPNSAGCKDTKYLLRLLEYKIAFEVPSLERRRYLREQLASLQPLLDLKEASSPGDLL